MSHVCECNDCGRTMHHRGFASKHLTWAALTGFVAGAGAILEWMTYMRVWSPPWH